jgi:hypothetical protein
MVRHDGIFTSENWQKLKKIGKNWKKNWQKCYNEIG